MNQPTDTERLDALERYIVEHGGIALHEGDISKARTGLGTKITGRTLRQAIDQSLLSRAA